MESLSQFQQYLLAQGAQTALLPFLGYLTLTAILASVLGRVYVKFGRALSNRTAFARQFVPLACTTMIIITVVKSSLALSLGLVGALSIVRFRTAVKEPEELIYLFLALALGLAFGAGQVGIALAGFGFVVAVVALRDGRTATAPSKSLLLTLSNQTTDAKTTLHIEEAVSVLKRYCHHLDLKRFDETAEAFEASFLLRFREFSKLSESKAALRKLCPTLKISFADYGGLL